jgi:pyrimidine oxygenase
MSLAKRYKDIGVFLPVANGGWIISKNTPKLDGRWQQNLDAALVAEEEGLDFVMSMGKWRGFGGETDHWGTSMESVTMMAGIAQATKRVKVWATMHTILHNPVVAAKMITTLDHISNGRAGLNIVAGAYRGEFEQMGAWDETIGHDGRYDLSEEWLTIIKRLWTDQRVDFHGKYFNIADCVSEPKPISKPRPDIICAGMSARGFEFSVREADACFIGGRSKDEIRDASRRAREVADRLGKTIKTYCMMNIVAADSDAEGERIVKRYNDGIDEAAVVGMMDSWGIPRDKDTSMAARRIGAFMNQVAAGTPETCREKMEQFIDDCDLDGLMLTFADYIEGLRVVGKEILPKLRAAYA